MKTASLQSINQSICKARPLRNFARAQIIAAFSVTFQTTFTFSTSAAFLVFCSFFSTEMRFGLVKTKETKKDWNYHMILLCLFWQKNEWWSHLNEPFDRKDGDDHGQACGIGVQQTEPLDCKNIYNIKAFTELVIAQNGAVSILGRQFVLLLLARLMWLQYLPEGCDSSDRSRLAVHFVLVWERLVITIPARQPEVGIEGLPRLAHHHQT